MKTRLPLYRVRELERAGVLTFLRPAGPRPAERPRKARVSAARRERRGNRAASLGRFSRLTRAEKWDRAADEWALIADNAPARPKVFSDCRRGPCPYVSCKFHLYLDVDPVTGAIKINHPDKNPLDLKQPCALRLGRKAKLTGTVTPTRVVAKAMNLTSERIRQTEEVAIKKLRVALTDDPAARLAMAQELGAPTGKRIVTT